MSHYEAKPLDKWLNANEILPCDSLKAALASCSSPEMRYSTPRFVHARELFSHSADLMNECCASPKKSSPAAMAATPSAFQCAAD